jgi:hypothetical protein
MEQVYDFSAQAHERLHAEIQSGSRIDEDDEGEQDVLKAYELTWRFLSAFSSFGAADELLQDWWQVLGVRQHTEGKRFQRKGLRAFAAFWLSTLHLQAQNHGNAFRWALIAHAQDILDERGKPGGAESRLRTEFGMNKISLDKLNDAANVCRNQITTWRSHTAFAEEVVRRFTQLDYGYADQIAALSASGTFPLSRGYFSAMRERANEKALDATEQGRRLEQLTAYLFSLLPGCVPDISRLDKEGAFQSDLIVKNVQQNSNMFSDLFGRYVLVECKNKDKRIGSPDVGYFLFRMGMVHAGLGVIVAPKGITGAGKGNEQMKDKRNAHALIRRNYQEYGTYCIVLDDKDLRTLEHSQTGFFWLLLQKVELQRFGERQAKS